MTVDITPTGNVYTVTDGAIGTEYVINFPYINTTDVQAYYTEDLGRVNLINNISFRVEGQTLITLVTLPLGAWFVIYRETELTQNILWVDGQAVYPPSIMNADDKLTFIAQELAGQVDRAVKVSKEDEAAGVTPDDVVQRLLEAEANAVRSAGEAATSEANAAISEANAATSAADAATSASEAATTLATAVAVIDTATAENLTSINAAGDTILISMGESAELARKWAENPENSPVIPDHYSAFHWAMKAAESGGGGGGGGTVQSVDKISPDPVTKNVQTKVIMTRAELDALESPTGSGLYPSLVNKRVVVSDDAMPPEANDGVPLLSILWSTLAVPRVGYLDVSQNNGLVSRTAFPDAWAFLESSGEAVTESAWQAEFLVNGFCDKFSTGDGVATFRIPFVPLTHWYGTTRIGVYDSQIRFPATGTTATTVYEQVMPFDAYVQVRVSRTTGTTGIAEIRINSTSVSTVRTSGGTTQTEYLYPAAYVRKGQTLQVSLTSTVVDGYMNIFRASVPLNYPMLKMYGSIDDPAVLNAANVVQMITGKLDVSAYEANRLADASKMVNAWAYINYDGTILKSHGIASVTKIDTNRMRITLQTPAPDANYSVQITPVTLAAGNVIRMQELQDATYARTNSNFYTLSTDIGTTNFRINILVIW